MAGWATRMAPVWLFHPGNLLVSFSQTVVLRALTLCWFSLTHGNFPMICIYLSTLAFILVQWLITKLLFMLKQVLKKHQMSSPMILQFLDNLSLVQQGLNKSLFYSLYSIDRLGSVYPLCMFQAATSERFKNKNKPRNVWLWVAFHCRDFLFTTAHSQKVNLVGILHERTLP